MSTARGGVDGGGGLRAPRAAVVAAFAAVYGIWGSTFLAISVAVETLPPLLMVAVRCLLAGAVMLGWARMRGEAWPNGAAWRAAAGQAVFLFGAYGMVAWAEQRVASGVAAVLAATSAIFVLLLDPAARSRRSAALGAAVGLVGVLFLAAPWKGGEGPDPAGCLALLGSSILWAVGAARSRSVSTSASTLMTVGMELAAGAAIMAVTGILLGEGLRMEAGAWTPRALEAMAYLVVFGSLVAYTAFHWLLGVVSPTLVATHAYVNPVIALALGWLLHGEVMTGSTLAAVALVLAGVVLVATATPRT